MNKHNKNSLLFDSYSQLINSTYPSFLKRLGINATAIKSEGATITDSKGRTYIDCIGGYGIFNLGHNPPQIINALIEILRKNQPFNKPFISESQVRLAELLADVTPGNLACSFVCNSGSEAIDNAIKFARLSLRKPSIIAAQGAFHGYTYGALSATGIPAFKRSFGPLVPNILHVPFGDSKALRGKITKDTAAVLLEPVQHEAGVRLASKSYFQKVREICDHNDILLIIDEIKTGFGKTGKMFACEYYGIVPDLLVLGKSMGGGLIPIGSLLGKKSLWKKFSFSFPMSASSFSGNNLACVAAIETIKILLNSNIIDDCAKKGNILLYGFHKILKKYPRIVIKVTGIGLLLGIQAINNRIAFAISKEMIKRSVLMFPAYGDNSFLMIEPPLVISQNQISQVLNAFDGACEELYKEL